MRVLICHGDPRTPESGHAGGAEALLQDTMRGLTRCGCEVQWWHGQGHIADAITAFRPDVIHAFTLHCYPGGLDALHWVLNKAKQPVVLTLTDYWPFCGNRNLLLDYDQSCSAVEGVCDPACREGRAIYAGMVNMARWTVALNETSADIYRRQGIRIDSVVHCGIDTDLFAPDPALRTPEPSIVTHAAWAAWPTKGMHVLKEALRGKPYSAGLLTGLPRETVAKALKKAHIHVFPSCYQETWGLCLTEAMASGCACIASDVAGARAQVQDGHTGLLVPRRDAQALGAAMDRLMGDKPLREALGDNARAWAAEHCSLEAMAARWMTTYRQAQAKTSAGSAMPCSISGS